ncbi:MAG TPA: 2,3-diphosphoglycerate-dependent phosphoglycerate mutase [Actinobacteria bacterium]|nr:2,3-bisphosphoglycerate-dependent phosphoglycerate mutase [bacterium BMS3Bbin02]HDL42014.1 2,3-diphosphoglycerate-dependent phosphoglycerate mutase [Actinomycetota bacterium]
MTTLVLLRHGESVWNLENVFTGWTDVALSDQGVREGIEAGELLADAAIMPDVAYTSVLRRAIHTLDLTLAEIGRSWVPVHKSWRLNERHYGALQGLNKAKTLELHGADLVHAWRRSYATPPPPLDRDDSRHPLNDERYRWMPPEIAPAAESLADVIQRMMPYWYDAIVPELRTGKTVIVVAHGNSLRSLVKHLDQISDEDIPSLNIPTGIPLVYELNDSLTASTSRYLGDQEAVAAATAAVEAQARQGS